MVTLLLVLAVLVTTGVMSWNSRRALLAETENQGLVIARLLARSAAFGAQVTSDVENAIGEQMVVEATIAATWSPWVKRRESAPRRSTGDSSRLPTTRCWTKSGLPTRRAMPISGISLK